MTIISHRHRCIFIAVPKSASHSIRFALRPYLDAKDEEQVALFLHKRIQRPIFASMAHGHQTAAEVREALGDERWRQYFSFAVVRNPWARFVSYVAFMKRGGEFQQDPTRAMRRVLENPQNQSHIHYRPQSDYVVDGSGQRLVTRICRAEHLQTDFDAVTQTLGLPAIRLDLHNASEHEHYAGYYDGPLIDAVAERYREDIERFGYRFGD
jgi:hypothetical protein